MLAELNVRHTRRHMPTRRVALDAGHLPMSGRAFGAALLAAVVAEHVSGLDEEQADLLPRFLADAHEGLAVPRIALRYRLQTDVHGLDRSRHRVLAEPRGLVIELDVHGHPTPQVIGAVMAAAAMAPHARRIAFRAVEAAIARPGVMPEAVTVRRLLLGVPGARPPAPGTSWAAGDNGDGNGRAGSAWWGVPVEQRWAMDVLGLRAGTVVESGDVQRRFRRLVREAHPDQGGAATGAAERIAELSEARELLLRG